MKAIFTILFIVFIYYPVFAQKDRESKTEIASFNLGFGVGHGQKIGLIGFSTLMFSNKLYTGIHIIGTHHNAMDLPEDYSSPIGGRSQPPPTDRFTSISAIIGKQIQKEKSNYRFSLEGGISFIRYNKLNFETTRPGFFSGYSSEYNLEHVPGLMLGSTVNYIVSKKSSLGLSVHGSFNSIRSVGFGSFYFAVNFL